MRFKKSVLFGVVLSIYGCVPAPAQLTTNPPGTIGSHAYSTNTYSTNTPGTVPATNNYVGSNAPTSPVNVYIGGTFFYGTNNPNGKSTAPFNSFYMQYDATGTNFVAQYVKTTTTGSNGWAIANVASANTTNVAYATNAGNASSANGIASLSGLPSGNLPYSVYSSGGHNLLDTSSQLNGANVVGAVAIAGTSSNLAPGTILTNVSISGDGGGLTNIHSSFTNIVSGFGNPAVVPQPGAIPLVGDDQAMGSATLTGQLWPAVQKPWKMIYGSNPTTNLYGATQLTYIITNYSDLYASQVTNDHSQVAIIIDAGWDGLRNTNWSWITNNWGTLTCDSNRFPYGVEAVCKLAHSNNIKVIMFLLYATNLTASGATEMINSEDAGAPLLAFTNGVSVMPTNVNGHWGVVSTPDTCQGDLQEISKWGVDMVCLADLANGMTGVNWQQASYAWGKAALYTYVPTSTPGVWNPPVLTRTVSSNGLPLAIMAYETPGNSGNQSHTMGYMTRQNHNAAFYDNSLQGSEGNFTGSAMRRICSDFAGQRYANEGGYVSALVPNLFNTRVWAAMCHGFLGQGYTNDAGIFNPGNLWTSQWYAICTNKWWCMVNQDPLQNWPRLAIDDGTNKGCVWTEQLADGSWVAAISCEGTPNYTPTITWDLFGWNTNSLVLVTGIYPDYGIVATNVVGISFSLVQNYFEIYRFVKCPPIYVNPQQMANVPGLAINGNQIESVIQASADGTALKTQFAGGYGSAIWALCPNYPSVVGAAWGQQIAGTHYAGWYMTSANNYDVYASGPIHGNASGLTNIPPTSIIGNITLTNGAGSRFRLDLGATTNLVITPL